jgi:type I restriction enzyme, S subunit
MTSWLSVALEEIAEFGSGGTPSRGCAEYYGGSIPWATIGDLTDGEVPARIRRILGRAG